MGWQTDVVGEITFNRETYNNMYEVDARIEEINKAIRSIENSIFILCSSKPKEALNCKDSLGNDVHPYEVLNSTLISELDFLKENYYDLFKLQFLKDNWPLRTGDYVKNINAKEEFAKFIQWKKEDIEWSSNGIFNKPGEKEDDKN